MAYIKKKSERKFKITVCNGYKVNGQKRMKAQTITVPSSVPKRGIQQYVMAEAERIEKKFKYGVEESDQTHFDRYAEAWLNRQKPYFKATTLAGYKRNLEIVCPFIGGSGRIRPPSAKRWRTPRKMTSFRSIPRTESARDVRRKRNSTFRRSTKCSDY